MAIDARTFVDIWTSFDQDRKNRFYDTVQGLRESTVRSYGTGRRRASGAALVCVTAAFKKMGINVGDGSYLFPRR